MGCEQFCAFYGRQDSVQRYIFTQTKCLQMSLGDKCLIIDAFSCQPHYENLKLIEVEKERSKYVPR